MSRCNDCGGEDCACCEVFIEQQADERYQREQSYDGTEYYESVRYASFDGFDEDEPHVCFDDGSYLDENGGRVVDCGEDE